MLHNHKPPPPPTAAPRTSYSNANLIGLRRRTQQLFFSLGKDLFSLHTLAMTNHPKLILRISMLSYVLTPLLLLLGISKGMLLCMQLLSFYMKQNAKIWSVNFHMEILCFCSANAFIVPSKCSCHVSQAKKLCCPSCFLWISLQYMELNYFGKLFKTQRQNRDFTSIQETSEFWVLV